MKDKINVAELLKDCPKGMELDCTIFENLEFDHIDKDNGAYNIICRVKLGCGYYNTHTFTEYGCYSTEKYSKCVIFPKGKTTWEGFHRPFKDGDIVHVDCGGTYKYIAIFKQIKINDTVCVYSVYDIQDDRFHKHENLCDASNAEIRLATEEEKERLFQALKDNGYKWNPETKTLEKLIEPKFRVGDWVVDSQLLIHQIERVVENVTTHTFGYDIVGGGYFNDNNEDIHLWTIEDAKDSDILCTYECDEPKIVFILKGMPKKHYALSYHCYYNVMYPYFAPDTEKGCLAPNDEDVKPATKEQRNLLFQKMKEAGYKWNPDNKTLVKLPKFKVGDRIKHKNSGLDCTLGEYSEGISAYRTNIGLSITDKDLEQWELAPNKFDITTLKPFDKVLVRDKDTKEWIISLFSHCNGLEIHKYSCINGSGYAQCIPYKGNEHLLGKTDDCNEFYKTWK